MGYLKKYVLSHTYERPSLMLLVVEVIAVLSRPVCSFRTADREVMSPDKTAVFTWEQRDVGIKQIT